MELATQFWYWVAALKLRAWWGAGVHDQLFSDGIGAISVVGGTVRLDFVSLSPTERDANGQPKAVFSQRIIMSVEGFLRAAGKVNEAAQAIAKASASENTRRTTALGKTESEAIEEGSSAHKREESPQVRDGKRPPPFP